MHGLGVAAFWAACAAPSGGQRDTAATGGGTPPLPALVSATWDCSADDDAWTLEAEADAWTGNGALALTLDALYVEEHPVRSVEAAPDGTWDRLELILAIAADPREVEPGERTAFLCDPPTREGLAARLWIHPPDAGEAVADCWRWGPEVDWAALGYDASCTAVAPPDDTATASRSAASMEPGSADPRPAMSSAVP